MPLINTLQEKANHPILSKIPYYLWNSEFYCKFNDDHINKLNKPFEELSLDDFPYTKGAAMILLRCCYPDVPPAQWIPFAQKEFTCSDFDIFHYSAMFGDIQALNWLAEKTPETLNDMIVTGNYRAFHTAARNAHLDVLNWLANNAPAYLEDMIKTKDYEGFLGAAANGHLHILNWFAEKAAGHLDDMIKNNYKAFRYAACRGSIGSLQWFADKAPSHLNDMIQITHYKGFRDAAEYGHIHILNWLANNAPGHLEDMIEAKNYEGFRAAAENGHLHILNWFAEKAPQKLKDMVAEQDFKAFRMAAMKYRHRADYHDTINWLLLNPQCLSYAEAHVQEYGVIVNTFIQETLRALHRESDEHSAARPNVVFDVTPERASHCFYMLRNLIRRNDRALDDEMRFLLNLPAVKALAHQNNNELLRLALSLGNGEGAQILLAIPAVNNLAAVFHYYQAEARNGIDVRELARNRESSMSALSRGEARRLEAAIQYYKKPMAGAGIPNLMTRLREKLIERYKTKPARITIDSQLIVLPSSHEDFKKLNLVGVNKDKALKAYYNHPDHTAWRYLSKPNHWMHPNAAYVEVNDARTERWSTFEQYQPFISMLFLAAIDVTQAPTEGHTLESRFEHFVKELALIGRAHNWDRTRVRGNKEEEYDDEEGDRPSCYSGVKRRLFQSVIGHDLLSVLTREKIQQEIRAFALDHFKSLLSNQDVAIELRDAYSNYILEQEDAFARPLLALNIPKERQDAFYRMLVEKYGDSFTTDLSFTSFFHSSFHLNEKGKTAERCHVLKLDGLTQIGTFLMGLHPEIPESEAPNVESEEKKSDDSFAEQRSPLPKTVVSAPKLELNRQEKTNAPNYSFLINCLAGLSTATGGALIVAAICTMTPVLIGVGAGLALAGVGLGAFSLAFFSNKKAGVNEEILHGVPPGLPCQNLH